MHTEDLLTDQPPSQPKADDPRLRPGSSPGEASSKRGDGLVLVFLFLVAGLGFTGIFYLRHQQAEDRKAAQEQISAVADLKVSQIHRWYMENLADASVIQETPMVIEAVRELLRQPATASRRDTVLRWLTSLKTRYDYQRVAVLDPQMTVRLVVPESETAFDRTMQQSGAEALRGNRIQMIDLHRGGPGDRISLDLLVPLIESNTVPVGLVLIEINPKTFLFPHIQSWPTPSRTAETLLVRREGNEVVFLNELRHRTNTSLRGRVPISQMEHPAVQAVRGKTGLTTGIDYRGMSVLADIRSIPDSPWFIVAKVDHAEIDGPSRQQAWVALLVLGTLILASGLGVWVVWRQREAHRLRRELELERQSLTLARRLAAVTQQASDIIVLMDDQWRILEANDRAVASYGYSHTELQRMTAMDLRAPDARQDLAQLSEQLRTQPQVLTETTHRRKDGSTFPVEISVCQVEIDGAPRKLAIARDFSERKRSETRLQQVNLLREKMLARLPLEEKLKLVTDQVVRILGADFARIWVIKPGDLCAAGCLHAQVTEGPHVCRFRDRCLHLLASSGRYTHIDGVEHRRVPFGCYKIGLVASGNESKFITNEVTTDPRVHNHAWARELGLVSFVGYRLLDATGQPCGVMAMFSQHALSLEESALLEGVANMVSQVIHTAQIEAVQQRLTRELEIRNQEMESLLYAASHDLRSPLVNIEGFSGRLEGICRELQELLNHPSIPEEMRIRVQTLTEKRMAMALHFTRSGVAKMNSLINGLLQLSRVGQTTPAIEPLNMDDLLRQNLDAMRFQLQKEKAVVKIEPLPPCLGNFAILSQVFANLLDNARKYRADDRPLEIAISGHVIGAEVVYCVADTGVGIAAEHQDKIWELFHRLRPDGPVTGEGLGLTLVRRLLNRLRGRAWVESVPHQGSRFYVALPTPVT